MHYVASDRTDGAGVEKSLCFGSGMLSKKKTFSHHPAQREAARGKTQSGARSHLHRLGGVCEWKKREEDG
jgi:hypothetical protein